MNVSGKEQTHRNIFVTKPKTAQQPKKNRNDEFLTMDGYVLNLKFTSFKSKFNHH